MQRIFYGWWVVGATTVGLTFSYATIGVGAFGFMIDPLGEAFGWQRAEVSLGLSLYTFAFVLFSPAIGWLFDRWGVRTVLILSITLFGLGFGSLYFLPDSLRYFYTVYLLLGILSVGTIPSGYCRVILNWFDQDRGLALAIGLSGVGVGLIVVPALIGLVLSNLGWRAVYLLLAGTLIFISLPVVTLLLKENPAEMGLLPDGKTLRQTVHAAPPAEGWLARQAIRTPQFWKLVVAFGVLGISTVGVMAHLAPLLGDQGLNSSRIAIVYAVLGIMVIIGRVFCGYLLDRFFAPYVAVTFLLCPAIGIACLATGAPGVTVYLAVVLIGLGGGAEFDLMSYLASRYLGLKAFGQLYGTLFAAFYLGGSIGPVFLGWIFDTQGSYLAGLWILAGGFVVAAFLLGRLGEYHPWARLAGTLVNIEN